MRRSSRRKLRSHGTDHTRATASLHPRPPRHLGFVRYYGDNKSADSDPYDAPGNEVLLQEFKLHSSPKVTDRQRATPLILFQRVEVEGRQKGNVKFVGLAVIERAEPVTQFNPATQDYCTNYVFEFAVLSLTRENDRFDWSWVAARRDPSVAPWAEISRRTPQGHRTFEGTLRAMALVRPSSIRSSRSSRRSPNLAHTTARSKGNIRCSDSSY